MKKFWTVGIAVLLAACSTPNSTVLLPNGIEISEMHGMVKRKAAIEEKLIPEQAATDLYFQVKSADKADLFFGKEELPPEFEGRAAYRGEIDVKVLQEVCERHPKDCLFREQ